MQIIQSKLLKNYSNLSQGFTTKHGGKSNPPFDSLNLAFHVGDERDLVLKNHALLANYALYNQRTLVHMQQIHSNIVHLVQESDDFHNPPSCDALITDKINVPLMVMVADCSPLLFYDDEKNVIAVAHSGRAGTFKNIVQKTVDSFVENFNSSPKDINVSVGPAICQECYEVGIEVYKEAQKLSLEYALSKKENKYYLDIRSILQKQLQDAGIKNIEISNECNSCSCDTYFSYRKEGKTGRFSGFILMKDKN